MKIRKKSCIPPRCHIGMDKKSRTLVRYFSAQEHILSS